MSTLARLRSLSAAQRRALPEAALALGRARLEIRCRPFSKIARSIEAPQLEERASASDLVQLEAITWAVRALGSRIPWYRNCLAQAVAAKRLLTRRGIASTLHLGVAPGLEPGPFEAHAWLEAGGRVITGRTEQPFEVLYNGP